MATRLPHNIGWLAATARQLLRARDGIAAVEFAIGASFLLLAMTALYDFGRASWHRMEVASAAQAGAVYAAAYGFNTTGIVAAVTSATSYAGVTASPAPTMICGCPNGSSGVTTATCGSTCPAVGTAAAQFAGYYVQVAARGTYSFVFPYPRVTNPVVISATSFVKLQ